MTDQFNPCDPRALTPHDFVTQHSLGLATEFRMFSRVSDTKLLLVTFEDHLLKLMERR